MEKRTRIVKLTILEQVTQNIFIQGTNITSSLGFNTEDNFEALKQNKSGIKLNDVGGVYNNLPLSLVNKDFFADVISDIINLPSTYTYFEQLLIWSAYDAISKSNIDVGSDKTIFVISTTKGNIDGLKDKDDRNTDSYKLWYSAKKVSEYFNNKNTPIVISNACVSGVMALNISTQLLQSKMYNNAVVIGGDVASDFVISGFMSFHALSSKTCKPFDVNRDGLTLGEASGCIVVSVDDNDVNDESFVIVGGSNTNDANHISGPSRTGEGLFCSINNTLKEANINASDIDFVSAHGTATNYNDEMEAIALFRSGLNLTDTNSFKGYWGHTLGASGIIEVIASIESMKSNLLIKSLGYSSKGTTNKLNIIESNTNKQIDTILKTSAGFGGVNSSIIIKKI